MNNLNEDIKILEEFIKYYESEAISRKFRGTLSISVDEYDIDAIEHLIKAYKELEYKYNKALSDLVQAEHKNKELKEENKVWKNSYYEQKEFNNKQVLYITEKFIPVSLVEETIKELKENGYWNYLEERDLETTIGILQELLEKRK